MDQAVELIALVCPQCATPVAAQPEEVAWVCSQCGKGLLLNPGQGLESLEVRYAAGVPQNTAGKPYWVMEGRVSLQRESYCMGSSNREAEAFWSQGRSFFIPAYTCEMPEMLSQGMRYLAQPPSLQEASACAFEAVTLLAEDIQAFAEFLVVAIEAGRKDKLKEIKFFVELDAPALWILPAGNHS
jgi:hypothetical protein